MKLLFFEKSFIIGKYTQTFRFNYIGLFDQKPFNLVNCDETELSRICQLMIYLEQKSEDAGFFKEDIIRTIIHYILLETAQIYKNKGSDFPEKNRHEQNLYYHFLRLIREENYIFQDVNYYADQLCISAKYLIRIVKKVSGKTPGKIIDEHIFQEAIILLNDPDKNISYIAETLNFSSISTFSRFFKRMAGKSPNAYRNTQNQDAIKVS